jgi:probable phosphoglycerate mutase
MRTLAGLVLALGALAACSSEGTHEAKPSFRVFVVRHGESWLNVEHPPDMKPEDLGHLTPRGREQASAAGRLIRSLFPGHVETILSSPRARALETAELLKAALDDPEKTPIAPLVRSLDTLVEGRAPDGSQTTFAWRVEQWKAGLDPRPEGGESLEDGQQRAGKVVMAGRTGSADVIVTHADIVAALLGKAAGTPIAQCWAKHEVPTGSVSEIEIDPDGRWRLVQQGLVPK